MSLHFPVLPMKASMGSLPARRRTGRTRSSGTATARIVHIDDGRVRLQSTAGHDVTANGGRSSAELAGAVHAPDAILDGELVVFDDDGQPSFELVQNSGVGSRREACCSSSTCCPSAAPTPSTCRTRIAAGCWTSSSSPATTGWSRRTAIGDGPALLEATRAQGLEGVMAKRLGSTYGRASARKDWRKVKNRRRVEVVIGGFTAARATDRGRSARCWSGADDGDALAFAGGVGTGLQPGDARVADRTRARALRTENCPFDPPPPTAYRRGATWVRAGADGDGRDRRVHQRRPRPSRQLHRADLTPGRHQTLMPRRRQRHLQWPAMIERRCRGLDAADPLARWRDEFVIADPDLVYLDGNSLGMPPRRTLERVAACRRRGVGGELIAVMGALARPAADGSVTSSPR